MIENNKNKSLLMFIGLPASGKTTLRKELIKDGLVDEVISADDIRFYKYKVQFDPNIEPLVWSEVKEKVSKCLSDGKRCLLDATNLDPIRRKDFINIADEYNADKIAIILNIDPDVAMVRNKLRKPIKIDDKMVGQRVPDDVMKKFIGIWNRYFVQEPTKIFRDLYTEGFNKVSIRQIYTDEKDCKDLNGKITEFNDKKSCLIEYESPTGLSYIKKYIYMKL